MARFDRYILSQLMMLFGFFSLVLVMVYWINRAVVLFDQLIANGQSAGVFVEFTALTLPNVIRLVLPIAAFAASIYVANRLSSESELLVVQASGFSPYRMVRPVLVFGVIVCVFVSVLTHFLVPMSVTRLNERQAEISENLTARLLNEGRFLHPAEGVTFYIREIPPTGELREIFLSDARDPGRQVTYTARQALLLRQDTGPKLVMFDGLAQVLDSDGRLSTTSFDDFAYDIGGLIEVLGPGDRSVKELTTAELIWPTEAGLRETGQRRAVLMYEGHGRISQALLSVVAALVGFSAMLVGNFSRFGHWKQILGSLVALIVLKSVDNALADAARSDAALWPLSYGATLLGAVMTLVLLWVSDRPGLFRRRPAEAAA
ncbi:MAG: LPS export ABC transporter permease LptF [Rhodobacter sp.]|nr:LPS export ABC transporter permease LptF [Rhodobacter sp.]